MFFFVIYFLLKFRLSTIALLILIYLNGNYLFQRVFQVGPRLFIGIPGLTTDTQTVLQRLKFRIKMYEMR